MLITGDLGKLTNYTSKDGTLTLVPLNWERWGITKVSHSFMERLQYPV